MRTQNSVRVENPPNPQTYNGEDVRSVNLLNKYIKYINI